MGEGGMAGLGGVLGVEASEGARGEVRAGGRVGLSPGRLAGASIKTIAEVAKWPSYISQKTFGLLMGEKGTMKRQRVFVNVTTRRDLSVCSTLPRSDQGALRVTQAKKAP